LGATHYFKTVLVDGKDQETVQDLYMGESMRGYIKTVPRDPAATAPKVLSKGELDVNDIPGELILMPPTDPKSFGADIPEPGPETPESAAKMEKALRDFMAKQGELSSGGGDVAIDKSTLTGVPSGVPTGVQTVPSGNVVSDKSTVVSGGDKPVLGSKGSSLFLQLSERTKVRQRSDRS